MNHKKIKLPKVPRQMKDIADEQHRLVLEMGENSFKIENLERRNKELYGKLDMVTREGMIRQEIDAQQAKLQEAKKEEVADGKPIQDPA